MVRPGPGRRLAVVTGPGDLAVLEVGPFVAGAPTRIATAEALRWRARRARSAIRTRAREVARRLPAPMQDVIRRLLHRRSG
jgi:hypothetical protein